MTGMLPSRKNTPSKIRIIGPARLRCRRGMVGMGALAMTHLVLLRRRRRRIRRRSSRGNTAGADMSFTRAGNLEELQYSDHNQDKRPTLSPADASTFVQ